jgi:hypothetical protein
MIVANTTYERGNIMLPTLHPLAKTATDLRRSINRLLVFKDQNQNDPEVTNGNIDKIIEDLKETRRHIPRDFWDTDLTT